MRVSLAGLRQQYTQLGKGHAHKIKKAHARRRYQYAPFGCAQDNGCAQTKTNKRKAYQTKISFLVVVLLCKTKKGCEGCASSMRSKAAHRCAFLLLVGGTCLLFKILRTTFFLDDLLRFGLNALNHKLAFKVFYLISYAQLFSLRRIGN